MIPEASNQPLTHAELKEFRDLFKARIAIAPNYEYSSNTGWDWRPKDELRAKEMISDITDYFSGSIDAGELNGRLQKYNEKFGVTYGCNGWNHKPDCSCGFGVPHYKK